MTISSDDKRGKTDSGSPVLPPRVEGSSSSSESRLRLALIRLVETWEREDVERDMWQFAKCAHDVRALLASPPAPGEK